jgi:carbonic anhydrase
MRPSCMGHNFDRWNVQVNQSHMKTITISEKKLLAAERLAAIASTITSTMAAKVSFGSCVDVTPEWRNKLLDAVEEYNTTENSSTSTIDVDEAKAQTLQARYSRNKDNIKEIDSRIQNAVNQGDNHISDVNG